MIYILEGPEGEVKGLIEADSPPDYKEIEKLWKRADRITLNELRARDRKLESWKKKNAVLVEQIVDSVNSLARLYYLEPRVIDRITRLITGEVFRKKHPPRFKLEGEVFYELLREAGYNPVQFEHDC